MYKLIVGALCASMSVSLYAQPQYGVNGNGEALRVASGFFLFGHCKKKCDELRCPDAEACNKACVDNKGTVTMCPKVEEKAKK